MAKSLSNNMVSKKLKYIFIISAVLFISHGIEEYLTSFYNVDSLSKFFFSYVEGMPVLQGTFLTFQFMWWLLLILFGFSLLFKNWQLYLMTIYGVIFIFELHHIVKAILNIGYYPGIITGLAFPIVGYFYWKELLHNWKR